MKTTSFALIAAAFLAAAPAYANPHDPNHRIINSYYHRYLGRQADPVGLNTWCEAIRCGRETIVGVEADILASPEYFLRNGNCDREFVVALYRDVAHAPATNPTHWVHRLHQIRDRRAFTIEFIRHHRAVVVRSAPVVVAAPTYVETYRPVYVAPAPTYVETYRPVYVAPAPVYVGGYYTRPGFGVSVGFGR